MTAGSGDAVVEIRGERLLLLPERAALWEGAGTLLVADPHWGKAAAFRAGGIPVPGGTTAEGLARLEGLVERTGARRVVFLGDFLHAREGRSPATLRALAEWRSGRPGLELELVRGNHDRHAGDPPPGLGIRCVDPPRAEPPFVLAHHPGESPAGYVLAGHLHPAVRLVGRGRQRERLPCFWFGAEGGVLPAFGPFTGAALVEPLPGDRVFVVAEQAVVEIGDTG
ncbi:MAG TPA: ligase-associated DNA damage response endonuclease PdeM [Longimicrobiaceae bacterium]|nr:ligase-associated DNA damage response endonuclease PdeM [Longimicrobiaceae bacterium]